jgi:hypothetical protein
MADPGIGDPSFGLVIASTVAGQRRMMATRRGSVMSSVVMSRLTR